ncbi:hypothetical protein [Inquilinus sp. Marseille-Q2685]|uniref:hypothetical protein n=1 Tax=Inquilinus sp. Marseille-Q2685 TaxID=2866581 RepID=UPI001CE46A22|nr:hypothetical protein [Inquilinus sp. Marseille-Q2685]
MQTADRMMSDGRSLAQTLHFWLRIQGQNWEDGFPPSPDEAAWICLALEAARHGSLGRTQECILHAILQDRVPPPEAGDYSLASFRRDLSAFQTRYLDSR